MSNTLTLYTRTGCPLCDEMAVEVAALTSDTGHNVVAIDVDADPDLKANFGWDVPLLFGDGVEICRHQLNLPAFREWLRAHP